MKANFLSPRAGMGGDFFVCGTPADVPDAALVELARKGIADRVARMNCPNCNPTARAYAYAQAKWIVAGIDKGD